MEETCEFSGIVRSTFYEWEAEEKLGFSEKEKRSYEKKIRKEELKKAVEERPDSYLGLHFAIRCNSYAFKAANDCPLGSSVLTLENGQTVRVVLFLLKTGEAETLLTNLFDLPEGEFPELYAMRWGMPPGPCV